MVGGWEIVSIADSTSMTESVEPKPIVPEFINNKITNRKLNVDNYIQWSKIVEINFTGRGKKSRLYTYSLSSKTDEWECEDFALFGQLLNIMELKIKDLVMHTSTLKEMWNYLEELYSERNNFNKAFDVI